MEIALSPEQRVRHYRAFGFAPEDERQAWDRLVAWVEQIRGAGGAVERVVREASQLNLLYEAPLKFLLEIEPVRSQVVQALALNSPLPTERWEEEVHRFAEEQRAQGHPVAFLTEPQDDGRVWVSVELEDDAVEKVRELSVRLGKPENMIFEDILRRVVETHRGAIADEEGPGSASEGELPS